MTRQADDEPDIRAGWRPVYTAVLVTLGLTLLLLGVFSRYFSG
ncbi:MAG: hypothetical protein AAF417_18095 [Pseudomonadota bacterium]